MSSIRVTNIEAKADASNPTADEKIRITDSQGRVLMNVDGKTSGITTVGLGTTSNPPYNAQMSFELTSNTNLRIRVRGTDGVLRMANITLSQDP